MGKRKHIETKTTWLFLYSKVYITVIYFFFVRKLVLSITKLVLTRILG